MYSLSYGIGTDTSIVLAQVSKDLTALGKCKTCFLKATSHKRDCSLESLVLYLIKACIYIHMIQIVLVLVD